MKLPLLAAIVTLTQLASLTLPTALVWAKDQERGREQPGNRGSAHSQAPSRAQQQRQTPPQRQQVQRPSSENSRYWDRNEKQVRTTTRRWQPALPFRHSPSYYVPLGRTRYYRDIIIVRPYGHWYPGYGFYYHDRDAFSFLAFTAITLAILNIMSQSQQRALENAQIQATSAPVGAPIYWNEGNAYGTVTTTRDGRDSYGRYCREFQQQVTIGARRETAYGTACREPDGSWRIVETR